MTMMLRKAPDPARRAVTRGLQQLRAESGADALLGGAVINLSEPLPIYRLGLDEADRPDVLARARQTGWRYLVEGEARAGFADVRGAGESDTRFASFAENALATRLLQAAQLAETVAPQLPDDVEPRILEIPALYVAAIWLAGPADVFIPYLAGPPDGTGVRVEPAFLDSLAARARAARLAGTGQAGATVPDEAGEIEGAAQAEPPTLFEA